MNDLTIGQWTVLGFAVFLSFYFLFVLGVAIRGKFAMIYVLWNHLLWGVVGAGVGSLCGYFWRLH